VLGLIFGAAGALVGEFSRAARRDPAYEPLFTALDGEKPEAEALPAPPIRKGHLPSEG